MIKELKDEGPSGLSIAALVTGILSMGVIPIVLGSVDLVRINNGLAGARGKGLDIAGIVLGALSIIIGIGTVVALTFWAFNWGMMDGTFSGMYTDFCKFK